MVVAIDLLKYRDALDVRQAGDRQLVFDPVRKRAVALSPEELVRQLLILYLHREKGYPLSAMGVEKALQVLGRERRFDLLLFNSRHEARVLVECKAPEVAINQSVFDQAALYNYRLKTPYLLVTNGLKTFCCAIDIDLKTYFFLGEIPAWS